MAENSTDNKTDLLNRFELSKQVIARLKQKKFTYARMEEEHPELFDKFRCAVRASNNPKMVKVVSIESLNELAKLVNMQITKPQLVRIKLKDIKK